MQLPRLTFPETSLKKSNIKNTLQDTYSRVPNKRGGGGGGDKRGSYKFIKNNMRGGGGGGGGVIFIYNSNCTGGIHSVVIHWDRLHISYF